MAQREDVLVLFTAAKISSQLQQSLACAILLSIIRVERFLSFITIRFIIKLTAACGGTLTAPTGNITSPSYPDNYPRNKRCVWKITGPRGQRISLKFNDFQLEGNGNGVRL